MLIKNSITTNTKPSQFHFETKYIWVHISSDNHNMVVLDFGSGRTMMPDANVFKQVIGSSRDSKLFYAF